MATFFCIEQFFFAFLGNLIKINAFFAAFIWEVARPRSKCQFDYILFALRSMTFYVFIRIITISTSIQYEELRSGKISVGHDKVIVKNTAHPNVFAQAKYFWSVPYNMNFTDGQGTDILIDPKLQGVTATFQAGHSLLLGLPLVYKEYNINYRNQAVAGGSDVYSILDWIHATHLVVNDENDLIYSLFQRHEELKNLKHLKHLEFNVNRGTYKRLQVKTFLGVLPALESATFVTKRTSGNALSDTESKEFVQIQEIPKKWSWTFNGSGVVYKLKRNENLFTKIWNFLKKIFKPGN